MRITARGRRVRLLGILLALALLLWGVIGLFSGDGMPVALPTLSESPSPTPSPEPTPTGPALTGFDVVINGGRVMDPDTNTDRIANVGIKGHTITAITTQRLTGRKTIDARGLVVAPGFIDNLSYELNEFGVWYKIADGITTVLGMHGLNASASTYLKGHRRWPVHYGGAFDSPFWRSQPVSRGGLGLRGAGQEASAAQIRRLAQLADQQIRDGWIGVDAEPEYSPGQTTEEMLALAKVAKRYDTPMFFHARYSDMTPPGTNIDSLNEIVKIAKASGAAVHVEHINSTGGTFSMPQSLALMERARTQGVDITACEYPYNYWSTTMASERFAPGWQERFRITYHDLEIPGTGERLTAESFKRYRAQNAVVVAYAMPEADIRTAMRSPLVMMGSDGLLVANEAHHPRGAGMAARLLGYYVREQKVISLMDALGKLTIMPAKRLQAGAPAMVHKGRMQVGADADITIFDPATIRDRATVRKPAQYSVGISWVLVMGEVVKDPNRLYRDVRPGIPILSATALAARGATP